MFELDTEVVQLDTEVIELDTEMVELNAERGELNAVFGAVLDIDNSKSASFENQMINIQAPCDFQEILDHMIH